MSRVEKRSDVVKAEEELKKTKQNKKLKQQEELANIPKSVKVISAIIVGVVFLFILIGVSSGGDSTSDTSNSKSSDSTQDAKKTDVVSEVNATLESFDDEFRSTLASTGLGGYQGDIEKVEADGDTGVKIHVSTYYDEAGEEGGQIIANKIFANICLDVPELSSVYVTSTSSGLDSRSVYRSDIPGCNQ